MLGHVNGAFAVLCVENRQKLTLRFYRALIHYESAEAHYYDMLL